MLLPTQAAVKQAKGNAEHHNRIGSPVVDVGAAVEACLDKFNHDSKYAYADEDGAVARSSPYAPKGRRERRRQ